MNKKNIWIKEQEEDQKRGTLPVWAVILIMILFIIINIGFYQSMTKELDNINRFEEGCSDIGYNKSYYNSGGFLRKPEYYCIQTQNGILKKRLDVYDIEEFLGEEK